MHKYFHWFYYHHGWRHYYNLTSALFMWAFLLLARPFGVYVNDLNHFFALALFLSPIPVVFLITSYSTEWVTNRLVSNSRQLKYNHTHDKIVWMIKLLLLVNIIYILVLFRCYWECFSILEYLEKWFAFILLFLLTYIPTAMYGRSMYFRSLAHQETGKIKLEGDSKDVVSIKPEDLLLIKADDNYVDLYIRTDEDPKTQTIRGTLKSIAYQLSGYPQFQQVHRSYIVNLKYTRRESFNALSQHHNNWSIKVPLSPRHKARIEAMLS